MTFQPNAGHFAETIKGPWETAERTEYRLVIDHGAKTIHVTGQMSCDEDWPDNLDFRVRAPAEQWFPDDKDILVHAGFLRQYKAVRGILMDAAYQFPDYAIRVDGFSLGAAWPQIFMQDVLFHFPGRDIKAILYAPGNPWRKLPRNCQQALKERTVFVRSVWDIVTWMRALRFYRYGKHLTVGKPWRFWPMQHLPDQITRGLNELERKGR